VHAFKSRLSFGVSTLVVTLALAAPAFADDVPAPVGPPAAPTFIPVLPPSDAAPVPDVPAPVPTVERVPESTPTPEPDRSAGTGLGASRLAVAALALAGLGLGFLAGSRRRQPTPAPAAPAAAAPRRTAAAAPRRAERRRRTSVSPDPSLPGAGRALVRSELDPDGYVELEGCLRRVHWAAPGEPPAVGEYVRVEQRGRHLVAQRGSSR
jgi:hypothetical protein